MRRWQHDRPLASNDAPQDSQAMTARQRLLPDREIERVITTLRKLGVVIGSVDIRSDGVTVHPPQESAGGNDFDRWLQKDKGGDRPAYRS